MKKLSIILVIISFCFAGCKKLGSDEFRISGTIVNGENKYVYINEMTPEGFLPMDTIGINEKGEFNIKMKYKEAKILILQTNDNNYITLIPNGGEDIKIHGYSNSLSASYKVENSPQSELLHTLNQEYIKTNAVLSEMRQTLHDNKFADNLDEIKKEILDQYNLLEIRQRELIKSFLQENKGSLACIIALYRKFDNHFLFSLKSDLDIYESVYQELNKTFPNNQHTLGLKVLIDKTKRILEEDYSQSNF